MARTVGAAGQPRTPLVGQTFARRLPLILAVAFGLLAAMGVNAYLSRAQKQPVQMATVVIAKSNITERSVIGADGLEERQIPLTYIHPQAARRKTEIAGRIATADITAGEQVLTGKVAARDARAGLSYQIPPGKRAVTIAVSEVKGVGGFIAPGDMVDVIVTVPAPGGSQMTKALLQGLAVLATAQKVEERPGEKPQVVASITLAVSLQEAERLILADESGRIRFALRPQGEDTFISTVGAAPNWLLAELTDRPVAVVPAVYRPASGAPAAPEVSVQPMTGQSPRPVMRVIPAPPAPAVAPPPMPASASPAAPPKPEVSLPTYLQLKGVVLEVDGTRRLAVVSADGRTTRFLQPGDVLPDGWTVVAIQDSRVILRHGEVMYELAF
jgi:pilus assembly protein CpaB